MLRVCAIDSASRCMLSKAFSKSMKWWLKVSLEFSALFDKVMHNEDLVPASSKTYSLLSGSLIHCFRDLPDDELSSEQTEG